MRAAVIAIAAFFATAAGFAAPAMAQSYDFDVQIGSPVRGPNPIVVREHAPRQPVVLHRDIDVRHQVCPVRRDMRELRRRQEAREASELARLQMKQDRRERQEMRDLERSYRRGRISAYELQRRQAVLAARLDRIEQRERADLRASADRLDRQEMARLVRRCDDGRAVRFQRDWPDRMIVGDDHVRVDGRTFYY